MGAQSFLSELPTEVLLDHFLPILPTPDLLSLGCTNKFFARLCGDETLWHRKLLAEFNFTGAGTARSSGWKFIYKNLDKPKVYVWGDRRNGRLGLTKFPNPFALGVAVPTQLKLPGVRVVSLVAGGWSFHALDSQGNIYVWGTLNSERMSLRSEGFAEPGRTASIPKKLSMPVPFRSISCGRMHSSALDTNNKIWTFVNWGRPFRMTCSLLDDPEFTPVQVECGWMFSCVLVRSGVVFAWFPFGMMEREIERQHRHMNQDQKTFALEQNGTVPCAPWDTLLVPIRLPLLPPLPDLEGTPDNVARQETKLVKIAAFDGHIVGLTNKGHLLKFRGLDNEETVEHGQWTYLPKFSEASALRQHPIYSEADAGIEAPESLLITHVSANYLSFVAYSTGSDSVVLMGDTDTTEASEPTIIPTLQNKEVISVVLGDYHSAALTASGKLYTWGKFSAGALGLGEAADIADQASPHVHVDHLTVSVPREVRFDHGKEERKDRFCLAVAASGWHTGALVIDLEPDDAEPDEDTVIPEHEPMYPLPYGIRQPGETPPFVPLPSIFRVGLAGRNHRGGFAGRGGAGRGGPAGRQNWGGGPTGESSSSSGQGGSSARRSTG